ncbi:MAG: DUF2252 domain-containing protein [Actinomycetia bacterium]|nr:DUF2252 domain-containing protein [Actinomycetes bacterium]
MRTLQEFATPAERKARGEALRKSVPRKSQAQWSPPDDRADPVTLITEQDDGRLQWLVPIRHYRMAESAFAFYRGAAKVMAADLSGTPRTGLFAQLGGDAHLSNFGSFASPERSQVFDFNDFDETLPGPWEWDLKRLVASFVIAGRESGIDSEDTAKMAKKAAQGYQQAMAGFASSTSLDVWYAHITLQQITDALPKKKERKAATKSSTKARSKGNLHALKKLTEKVDGQLRIKSDPPLLIPLRDLPASERPDDLQGSVEESLIRYRESIDDDMKLLLDRYRIVDIALKVVGVGSVGTRCMIVLFEGNDEADPLFLQIKEASDSVLEDYLPKSVYSQHGQRVVEGQHMMQTTSDIFLGWTGAVGGHQYYWRQLYDMKGSADVSKMTAKQLRSYASLCGWTLAHAHSRSGDPIEISGYIGSGTVFSDAFATFASAYADQNENDYKEFKEAIKSGRISATEG